MKDSSHSQPDSPTALQSVGIIGGGQLAEMMVEAAQPLGLDLVIQTPHTTDPALQNSGHSNTTQTQRLDAVLAPVADAKATARLSERCQVITFENEFVNLPELQSLADQGVCFRPRLATLAALLDKYEQRQFLQAQQLPVPQFAAIAPHQTPEDLGLSYPLVLKSRRHGYDGQGTFILRGDAELQAFWQGVPTSPAGDLLFMAEAFVPFERELAIMAARSATGEVALYPVVETYQPDQVCRWAIAPAAIAPETQSQIQAIAQQILEHLDVVGILGIELFLTSDGTVLVNEIAPRTHNSGHLTIEACATSQFEQHLRAVCGRPLGPTTLTQPAVMVNLLGFEVAQSDYAAQRQAIGQAPNAFLHWYGKAEARPGRKLGHVTVLLETAEREQAIATAQAIEALWYPSQNSA